jgi:hypothetical protein
MSIFTSVALIVVTLVAAYLLWSLLLRAEHLYTRLEGHGQTAADIAGVALPHAHSPGRSAVQAPTTRGRNITRSCMSASSCIRTARVSMSISAALAIPVRSIKGSRLRSTPTAYPYPVVSGPHAMSVATA